MKCIQIVIMLIPWENHDNNIYKIKGEKNMHYIYCYINKVNNHKYVG